MKTTHRNAIVVGMNQRFPRSMIMKHRSAPRGGDVNDQQLYLSEYEEDTAEPEDGYSDGYQDGIQILP